MQFSFCLILECFLSCFSLGRKTAILDHDSDNSEYTTTSAETLGSLLEAEPDLNFVKPFPNDLTDQVTLECSNPVAFGGFADIYRGVLQRNGGSIKVAVKVIKTFTGGDPDTSKKRKRLRREVDVWSNLKHPNILELLGTTMGFGQFPAMVSPWADKGVLTLYLRRHWEGLAEFEILGILRDVAAGIHYLHSNLVVHGDLSGSNIFIRGNGEACIADFGLSTLLTERSAFATSLLVRGTLPWAAPEFFDIGDGAEDEPPRVRPTLQSDVYSFGSIMLQILSGKVPYHYYSRPEQVMFALSNKIIPKRPSNGLVTVQRWDFMQRCWSTVDIMQTRPSSEAIFRFVEQELGMLKN